MSTLRVDRFGQYAIGIPSITDATPDGVWRHIEFACPFRDCHSLTIHRQRMVDPGVVALFDFGSPTAIVRLVVAVIVDAVKRMTVWAHTHVVEEILERFTPSGANLNTTCAVVLIFAAIRVVAATYHLVVGGAQWMIGQSMSSASFCCKFFLKASATKRSAFQQVTLYNGFLCAAFATTHPQVSPVRNVSGVADHSPSAELYSGQVQSVRASSVLIGVTTNKAFRFAFYPAEFCIRSLGDWCGVAASAFTQLLHNDSLSLDSLDTQNTNVMTALYHRVERTQIVPSAAMAAL